MERDEFQVDRDKLKAERDKIQAERDEFERCRELAEQELAKLKEAAASSLAAQFSPNNVGAGARSPPSIGSTVFPQSPSVSVAPVSPGQPTELHVLRAECEQLRKEIPQLGRKLAVS